MPLALPIYMDAHATTPVDPRVLEAMNPFFSTTFGNAASRTHAFGREAAEAVERARAQTAAALGAEPREIVWTSGATEADNLALQGAADRAPAGKDGLVVAAIEHKAVLDTARHLASRGFRVTFVRADASGFVDLDELARAVNAKTFLVSIMAANNEIGVLQPMAEIARIVREKSGALLHTDATQAVGGIPVDVRAWDVDLLSVSAHKVYGPKGAGALFVRRRPLVRLSPILHGGGHERGMRSGTINVPGVVGLGAAFEIAAAGLRGTAPRTASLRDRLRERITGALDEVTLNGPADGARRLPNNLHLSFARVDAEELMLEMPDVAVSTGAACSSASLEPSHVLEAIGLGRDRAQSSLRFGLLRTATEEEVDYVAERVVEGVNRLRALAAAK